MESVQSILNSSLDLKSSDRVKDILSQVSDLTAVEKLALYLQLPVESSQVSSVKTAGKKAEVEVAQTYSWIRTHLIEDHGFSLAKQEVYDDYRAFCLASKMDPLCVADFGKAMKQVFPGVKPRRLGQRGNSKYCYAGLKKRFEIETPQLKPLELSDENSLDQLMKTVSVQDIVQMVEGGQQPLRTLFDLILKWTESVGVKFSSIKEFIVSLLQDNQELSQLRHLLEQNYFQPIQSPLDSGLTSVSSSPFVSPQATPTRTRHSSGPLRYERMRHLSSPYPQSSFLRSHSVPAPDWTRLDLQTTLEDLKDCDNEFSRFAQDLDLIS